MGRLLAALLLSACATSSDGRGDASVADAGDRADASNPAIDAPARPPCVEGDARTEDPLTGHCYMLFNQQRSWAEAETACAAVGEDVHFATVTGNSENAVVNNLAGQEVWIGGNDIDVEMSFIWVTGETFAFTNWRGGEPSGGGEDCIVFQGQLNGVWDDRPCGDSHPIVCERD